MSDPNHPAERLLGLVGAYSAPLLTVDE